ncbi:hypothetical protein [Bradyrhizobium sp. CB2312]|nr:hypothetical protein [Bradyrhizobium sp. CB2312]WFU70930.1 hypothetical protein QA642_37585 [Bradyrhizobium sp. CB2312]
MPVRPDGYIGAFVGSQQSDALAHFLAEQGLPDTGVIAREGGRSSIPKQM